MSFWNDWVLPSTSQIRSGLSPLTLPYVPPQLGFSILGCLPLGSVKMTRDQEVPAALKHGPASMEWVYPGQEKLQGSRGSRVHRSLRYLQGERSGEEGTDGEPGIELGD